MTQPVTISTKWKKVCVCQGVGSQQAPTNTGLDLNNFPVKTPSTTNKNKFEPSHQTDLKPEGIKYPNLQKLGTPKKACLESPIKHTSHSQTKNKRPTIYPDPSSTKIPIMNHLKFFTHNRP